jgi:hypothetical protein
MKNTGSQVAPFLSAASTTLAVLVSGGGVLLSLFPSFPTRCLAMGMLEQYL